MAIDLSSLKNSGKLLFAIELTPVQGSRFQPTGFPNLGAATFQTKDGVCLLVESPQSLANRLESVCWDAVANTPVVALSGLSYIEVKRKGAFLTSSMTEAHRINSPYILEGSDKSFFNLLKKEFGVLEQGAIDRKLLAEKLFKYDIGSLIHGVFLAKKELAGGRLRVARALSAFIEAEGVKQAISGGVKNDAVNPSGSAKDGFGNVPFSREEYTAEKITLFVNLDLAQIRGYGLDDNAVRLLTLLALFKIRGLVDGELRLRTACDLTLKSESVTATKPIGFALPDAEDLAVDIQAAIAACKADMTVSSVKFDDELKVTKDEKKKSEDGDGEDDIEDGEKV